MYIKHFLCLLLGAFAHFTSAIPVETDFNLHIVHLNDFHARFEETSRSGSVCKSDCIGGFSRLYTAVLNEINRRPSTIFLNAGDNFQGTLWYNIFKWNGTQHFLNKLPTEAYTLGNHEFDDNVDGVVPFIKSLNAPTVAVNIDDTKEPDMQGIYNKSIIIKRGNRRIGIIGVLLASTDTISNTGKLKFLDESASVNQEAERLVAEENVDTIIVLSHCGYDIEKKIAEKASPKISVIVGAHSHSFLYTGNNPPGIDKPAGPYPTVIRQKNGRQVLVVQASAYLKFLGNITIRYNNDGDVISWSGEPIYLDNKIPQDPQVNNEIAEWKKLVDEYGNKIIGRTQVLLDQRTCSYNECNLGNLITDSMVNAYLHTNEVEAWTYASIAIVNPGGIRTSIEKGNITYSDLVSVQPFENTCDVGEIQGKYIKEALEYSTDRFSNERIRTRLNLLQMSGIRVVFNTTKPAGSRVQSLKLRCRKCNIPKYEEYDPNMYYRIVVNSFVARGGDGFTAISDNLINHIEGPRDIDVLEEFVKKLSPISIGIEGRIKVVS